jgi:Reverse transcriptase (RNA-dependent DNA polymerase)
MAKPCLSLKIIDGITRNKTERLVTKKLFKVVLSHARGQIGAFVNYEEFNYGYRIWNTEQGVVETTRDVRFLNKVLDGGFDVNDETELEDQNLVMVAVPMGFLTAKQIQELPDYDKWMKAIDREHESLLSHAVWSIEKRSSLERPLGTRWVLARKEGPGCEPFKAGFVLKRKLQRDGFDVGDTFSPTLSKDSLKIVMATVVRFGLVIKQMELKSAYLHGNIDSYVVIELSELVYTEEYWRENVGVLRKALYSLKQAPLLWCERLSGVLISIGFGRCEVNACVYARKDDFCVVAVFPDDLLICGDCVDTVEGVKAKLEQHFTMTDMGTPQEIVRWNVKQTWEVLKISQSSFIKRLAERYESYLCKRRTPKLSETLLHGRMPDEAPADEKVYRSLMGSLQYLATGVRVDVVYIINVLARYVADPAIRHLKIASKVLSYIVQTPYMGLEYKIVNESKQNNITIKIYCDADVGGPKQTELQCTEICR